MNVFELASKMKLRFPYKGLITVEDLWDLTVAQLDSIYRTLTNEAKQSEEESLLDSKKDDVALRTKIEIIKHIFNVKKTESEEAARAAENAAKRQRILEIIAKKQDESLENMSEEELLRMLGEIGG